ncbi:MAG: hypothetical protein ACE5OZ_19005 [Candidatus Heimdallarchaeota archaeon]
MVSATGQNPGEALVLLFSGAADQYLEARLRWHRFVAKQQVWTDILSQVGLDDASEKNKRN